MDQAKLEASIMAHEGQKLFPYTDSAGKTTIGVGRNLTDRGISSEESLYLLGNDIQSAIRTAEAQSWWPAIANDDVRGRAVVEMLFNLGLGGLSTFKDALACLGNADFSGAAANFMDSKWAQQVGNRAIVLTKMIETGCDPS